jgi:hypothetical protein
MFQQVAAACCHRQVVVKRTEGALAGKLPTTCTAGMLCVHGAAAGAMGKLVAHGIDADEHNERGHTAE